MNIFTQFFKGNMRSPEEHKQEILQDLMRREADLNKTIFGPVPEGVKRDFFCLDKHTWVWYEEWMGANNQRQQVTTRYIVRTSGIVKSQNGGAYHRLTLEEAKNFQKATAKYAKKVGSELYQKPQPAKA